MMPLLDASTRRSLNRVPHAVQSCSPARSRRASRWAAVWHRLVSMTDASADIMRLMAAFGSNSTCDAPGGLSEAVLNAALCGSVGTAPRGRESVGETATGPRPLTYGSSSWRRRKDRARGGSPRGAPEREVPVAGRQRPRGPGPRGRQVRRYRIRILPGDRVRVEVSPYDLDRGGTLPAPVSSP